MLRAGQSSRIGLTAVVAAVFCLFLCPGCHSWQIAHVRQSLPEACDAYPTAKSVTEHLDDYRKSCSRAASLETAENDGCVDWYFAGTRSAWLAAQVGDFEHATERANSAYHDGLANLLRTAQRFGRLHPTAGLCVYQGTTSFAVPVRHYGFAWQPGDFQQLSPPAKHLPSLLRTRYCQSGCGVPLVITRCRNDALPIEARFYPQQTPFAATAVLRFGLPADGGCLSTAGPVLEFYNPLQIGTVSGDDTVALASDLTAPLAAVLQEAPRTYFVGFIQPGNARDQARLAFLEPYQPGKVPVVLIHGLYSDPQSWADMINDLRASPQFSERFQIWTFRYPTGQGFLQSAAKLRIELQAAYQMCDPAGCDPALQSTVLVGHSMGGLIGKMQVTESEDKLWRRIANRPLEEIQADETIRQRLQSASFFHPSPNVSRLIFIATPHMGANSASGVVGRVSSALVQTPPEDAIQHQQLIAQNPGVFADYVQARLPTSVDLLRPNSPALEALREMCINPRVTLHNIIAVHDPIGPSDGVVPVASAWHPNCQTERSIASPHGRAHRASQASCEVMEILNRHWAEMNADDTQIMDEVGRAGRKPIPR